MRRSSLGAILLVLLAGCEVFVASLGPTVQVVYGHDAVMFLDTAWRIQQGQVPFRDIQTDTGVLFPMLLSLLAGNRIVTVGACVSYTLLLTAGATVWGWLLSLRRLTPGVAFAACCALALLACGAYNQGDPYHCITYAMIYNRLGYVILFLIGIELFSRQEDTTPLGGASTGFLLASLLFVKITFLFTALGFLVLRQLAIGLSSRRWWLAAGLGAAACLLPLLVYLRFNLTGVLENQFRMALYRAGTGGYTHPQRIHDGWLNVSPFLVCLLLLWWRLPRPRGRAGLLTLGLLAAGLALMFTSYSEFGILDLPLGVLLALLLLDRHVRAGTARGLVLVLVAAICGPWCYRNVASLWVAHELKQTVAPGLARFTAQPLRDLLILGPGFGNGPGLTGDNQFYVDKINDGCELLRNHCQPTDRVATFTFENPFSLALELRSPRGLPIAWHHGANFNEHVFWPAEQALGDATLIMVPRQREMQASTPLLSIYRDYLVANFSIKAQSAFWVLLERSTVR